MLQAARTIQIQPNSHPLLAIFIILTITFLLVWLLWGNMQSTKNYRQQIEAAKKLEERGKRLLCADVGEALRSDTVSYTFLLSENHVQKDAPPRRRFMVEERQWIEVEERTSGLPRVTLLSCVAANVKVDFSSAHQLRCGGA